MNIRSIVRNPAVGHTTRMQIHYPNLLLPSDDRVAEKPQRYETITERHIQALWLEQKYFNSLTTPDGQPVFILSPGLWNVEAGPDFLRAHIRIGDREYRGDIEIHLSQEGWNAHGHAHDPRYNDVVLHLVLWPARTARATLCANGRSVPTIFLEPFLTVPIGRLLRLIDLELYPYKRFTGSGRCSQELFNKEPSARSDQLLRSAARHRLESKAQLLKQWHPTEPLLAGIAMALGYKRNARAFLELFLWARNVQWATREHLFAALLGCSGFFEPHHHKRWKDSAYYAFLMSLWWTLRSEADHQAVLELQQVRPLNHPVRRLAYLSHLMTDPRAVRLQQQVLLFWEHGHAAVEPKVLLEELIALLPSYTDTYWDHHFTFESEPKSATLSLMGRPLRLTTFVNAVLPLLWEKIAGRPGEIDAFERLYTCIPAERSRKSLYLKQRFFGDCSGSKLLTLAIREQGAYQIHQDFCVHYEASCEGCPFVQRVQRA